MAEASGYEGVKDLLVNEANVNVILKDIGGRLFPTGALRLLFGAHRLRDYRLWGLAVLPEYQGLGLDVREKLGMSRIKTYRVYEKVL